VVPDQEAKSGFYGPENASRPKLECDLSRTPGMPGQEKQAQATLRDVTSEQ
jgi:hypothetical protein